MTTSWLSNSPNSRRHNNFPSLLRGKIRLMSIKKAAQKFSCRLWLQILHHNPQSDKSRKEAGLIAREASVRVNHELLGSPFIEVFIPLRPFVKRNNCYIDCLRDFNFVVQDGHHQFAVILHYRALPGCKRVRLGPPEPKANAEVAKLRLLIRCPRVFGDVESRDAESAPGPCDFHQRVQDRGRHFFLSFCPMAARFETYTIHCTINFRLAHNGFDLLRNGSTL